MEAFQQRLIDEHKNLQEKISKLDEFIFSGRVLKTSPAEQVRLRLQLKFMELYAEVLNDRISAFGIT